MPWANKRPTAADAVRRREYDSPAYRATRKALGQQVAAGLGRCWRCGRTIPPGTAWHTGHDDNDRTVIRGVECVTCNLSAASRKASRATNARRRARRQSRDWL